MFCVLSILVQIKSVSQSVSQNIPTRKVQLQRRAPPLIYDLDKRMIRPTSSILRWWWWWWWWWWIGLGLTRGSATDFMVGGTKQDSRAEQAKKFFVPSTFPNVGGTSKQIPVGDCWIYWNLLSGFRINKHRQGLLSDVDSAVSAAHVYCCVNMLACRFEQCSSPVGWTVETRPKPSFQISLTWQVSTI